MDEHQLNYTKAFIDDKARLGQRFVQCGECSCGRWTRESRSADGVTRARRNLWMIHSKHKREQHGQ